MPARRFDKKEWLQTDKWRASLAGQEVIKFMMIWDKGDWAEICERIGYPTWTSATRPCYCCNAAGADDLFSPVGLVSGDTVWVSNTDEDYLVACERCEIFITITDENISAIWNQLAYSQAGIGLTLRNDVPGTALKKGDRVEPTRELPDVAEIGQLARPCRVLFWRRS